jgi:hypothetical protein
MTYFEKIVKTILSTFEEIKTSSYETALHTYKAIHYFFHPIEVHTEEAVEEIHKTSQSAMRTLRFYDNERFTNMQSTELLIKTLQKSEELRKNLGLTSKLLTDIATIFIPEASPKIMIEEFASIANTIYNYDIKEINKHWASPEKDLGLLVAREINRLRDFIREEQTKQSLIESVLSLRKTLILHPINMKQLQQNETIFQNIMRLEAEINDLVVYQNLTNSSPLNQEETLSYPSSRSIETMLSSEPKTPISNILPSAIKTAQKQLQLTHPDSIASSRSIRSQLSSEKSSSDASSILYGEDAINSLVPNEISSVAEAKTSTYLKTEEEISYLTLSDIKERNGYYFTPPSPNPIFSDIKNENDSKESYDERKINYKVDKMAITLSHLQVLNKELQGWAFVVGGVSIALLIAVSGVALKTLPTIKIEKLA